MSVPELDENNEPIPQPITSVEQYRRPPGEQTANMQMGGEAPTRLPKRIVRCPMRGVYKGFYVQAWVNYPVQLLRRANKYVSETEDPDEFGIDEEEKAKRQTLRDEALKKQASVLGSIVLETNLVDYEGNPFGDPSTKEFWEGVAGEIQAMIFDAIAQQIGKLNPPKARA